MFPGTRTWQRAFVSTALIFGSIAVALGICEGLARLTWPSSNEAPVPTAVPPGDLPELRTLWDIAMPNVHGISRGHFYRANSAGFRRPEYSETPRPGVFRIVIAGDSVTMGAGVTEEGAYPARVEAMLNAPHGDARYEVLNLGLSGLNIRYVVQRLETIGLRFRPDLVAYGFTVNDIESPAYRASTDLPTYMAHRQLYYRFRDSSSFLLRVVWPRLMSVSDTLLPRPGSTCTTSIKTTFTIRPRGQSSLQVSTVSPRSAASKVCASTVLIHTHLWALSFVHPLERIYARVGEAAAERGLSVTQSLPTFLGRDESALTVGTDDPHPNAAGHELLARAPFHGLRELPSGCWVSRSGSAFVPAPDAR